MDAWKEEYRGVDLISNRGLSVANFTDSYNAGTTPDYDYINFEELTVPALYGSTTGLPASPGSVYRLELVNLMPDGDFELRNDGDNLDVDPFWTVDPGATLEGDNAAGLAITGMSAYFEVAGREAAFFDLRGGLLDTLVYPGSYHLNLLLRRATDITRVNFDYGSLTTSFLTQDNISWESDPDPANATLDVEIFPNDVNIDVVNIFGVAGGTEHYLYVGAPETGDAVNGQQGHIDDVRIGRYDIFPHVALPLGSSVVDGSLDILPGLYRFSTYVKSEIDSEVTPNTANAFRPGQVTLGINGRWGTTTIAEAAWSASEWVQVSFDGLVRSADLNQADAVTLRLTVTSDGNPMVGRILIAAPTFELVVN